MNALGLPTVEGLDGARVLVTGGAGFIGSSLVRVLLGSGAQVTVYDNLATGTPANLEGCEAETGARPHLLHGDVRDTEKLARTLPGMDLVFHLACLGVRHSLHSPLENHEVNARGTLVLLGEARRAGVRRVVHVSSSEVYGTAKTVPMSEEHPTDPHTVYGASKLAGECYARASFRCHGQDVVVIRPFNAYGPRSHHEGDCGEVIPRFLVRALTGRSLVVFGDGAQTRDLTHVYDTAAALARAGVVRGLAGETLNVGAGSELRIRELAERIREIAGRPELPIEHLEPRPGDVLRLYANPLRARELLGHQSRVELREGLGDLAARLRALGPERLEQLSGSIVNRNWE